MIARLEAAWADPTSRVRIVKWLWLISTGVVVLGAGLIAYLLFVAG